MTEAEFREISTRLDAHMRGILEIVELAAPSDKYSLARKLIMNHFGHSGLRSELAELLDHGDQSGMDRQGQGPVTGRKGGAP